jgi:hypothetical protein
VLHWSTKTLTGPSFLTNHRKIPLRFESSEQWFDTFFPFILEELRCNIKGAIENFDENSKTLQPLIEIPNRGKGGAAIASGGLSFEISDEKERNFIENNVNGVGIFVDQYEGGDLLEALKTKNHFFVHVDFLHRPTTATRQSAQDLRFKCQFPQKSFLGRLAQSKCEGWSFIPLDTDLSAVKRVCDAMASRVMPPFMDDILRGKVHRDEQNNEMIGDLDSLARVTLNDSQTCAIRNVLRVGLSGHPRIQLIKGPPGLIYFTTPSFPMLITCSRHRKDTHDCLHDQCSD